MRGERMEIEDKLKDAATWQPTNEMPVGLERRALAQRRPPLRPIGLARPAFSTLLAAAACGVFVHLTGTSRVAPPVATPSPLPVAVQSPRPAASVLVPERRDVVPERQVEKPATRVKEPPKATRRTRTVAQVQPRKKRVRIDTEDPIVVQSRVAVDEPIYAPAYYAQPSADGTSVEFTPVVATLGDPDVIYTP